MLTKKLFMDSFVVYVFTEIAICLSNAIDGIIVARTLGSEAMAAMGLCVPLYSIVGALWGLIAVGMQNRCLNYLGKGDINNAQKIFGFIFPLWMLLTIILAIFGIIYAGNLAEFFGGVKGTNLYEGAKKYLIGDLIGLPALIAVPILSAVLQMDSNGKLVSYGVSLMAISNIILDLLNGYVFYGGLFGMGLATSIANYLAMILMLTHFFKKDSMFKLRLEIINFKELIKIFSGGAPRLTKNFSNTLRPLLINRFILYVGSSSALAAYSVQGNFSDVVEVIGASIASAILLLGGVFFSERDETALDELIKTAFKNILYFILPIAVLIFIFAPEIAGFYIKDSDEVLNMAIDVLRAFAISLPVQACGESLINIQQVTDNFKFVHIFTFLNKFLLIVSATFIFGYLFGVNGIWFAIPGASFLLVMLELIFISLKNKSVIKKFMDLYGLEKNFSYDKNDELELSPKNEEEIIFLSSSINEFCEAHNIDLERAYIFALCVEEMGMNVIKHGFSDGKKHEMSARIIYERNDGNLIFRLRDDCGTFNVKERALKIMDSPPEKGIGIKLVMQSAKDVKYVHVLNTNTIIITV